MPPKTKTDTTLAERQARFRERRAAREQELEATIRHMQFAMVARQSELEDAIRRMRAAKSVREVRAIAAEVLGEGE